MKSPKAEGLFQRAIAESGAAFFAPMRSLDDVGAGTAFGLAESQGEKFLSGLGVKNIAAARALTADKIQAVPFDPHATYDNELLPCNQQALYKEHKFNDTPILIGFNSGDGALFVPRKMTYLPLIKQWLFVQYVKNILPDCEDEILALYPHGTGEEALRSAKELVRDGFFAWSDWCWARLQSQYGKGKTFFYCYDYHTPKNTDGAWHGAEIRSVFLNLQNPQPDDVKMADIMSTYWVNFAKSGNPNGNGLPEWKFFNPSNPSLMVLNLSPQMAPVPNLERLEVLDTHFSSQLRLPKTP